MRSAMATRWCAVDVARQRRQRAVRHADRDRRHVLERVGHREQEDVHRALGIADDSTPCPLLQFIRRTRGLSQLSMLVIELIDAGRRQ